MRSYKDYLNKPIVENEEISSLDKFKALLGDRIDALVYQLKKELISGASANSNRASMWDKVKNWGSNLLWGKTSPANPYRWVNQFGHLGTQNSLTAPQAQTQAQMPTEGIEFYKIAKESAERLDKEISQINEAANPALSGNKKTTVLFSIIDQWGNKLKADILDTVTRNLHLMQPSAPEQPNQTAEAPATSTEQPANEPVAEPEAKKPEPETADDVFNRILGPLKNEPKPEAPATNVEPEQPKPAPVVTAPVQAKAPEKAIQPEEIVDNITLIDRIKAELHNSNLNSDLKKDIDEEFNNIIAGKKKKAKNQKLKELLASIKYYKANSDHINKKESDPSIDDLMSSPEQIDWDSLTNN